MRCKGNFVFKSLIHRDGGVFVNDEGKEVPYKGAYVLKVDEILENGDINERKFRIKEDKTVLINELGRLVPYEKINLEFNVTLYTSSVSLELINVCD